MRFKILYLMHQYDILFLFQQKYQKLRSTCEVHDKIAIGRSNLKALTNHSYRTVYWYLQEDKDRSQTTDNTQ